jgi:chromosome partitioning protein
VAKYISFANRKGGVGKTTLLNLTATALSARTNKRILVIDADEQQSIYNQRKADLSNREHKIKSYEVLSFSFLKKSPSDVPVFRFTKLIQKLDDDFDLIFIDPAGTMEGEVTPLILTLSDAVVIPVVGSVLDIQSTLSFLNTIEAVNKEREEPLQVIGVINKKDRTSEYNQIEQLNGFGGLTLLKSALSNRVEYRRISTLSEVVSKDKAHQFNKYLKEISKALNI